MIPAIKPLVMKALTYLSDISRRMMLQKTIMEDRWVIIAALVLVLRTVIHYIISCRIPLSGDEAYYWMWSKHPAMGYYDHPPMVAWLIAAGRSMRGDTTQGIRLMSLALSTLSALLIFFFSRRISGSAKIASWSMLLFLCIPLMTVESIMAAPDGGLIFFWILSLAAFHDALLGSRKTASWLWAGVFWAAAFLCKFMALLFLPSLLLFLLITPDGRRELRSGRPLIAAVAALICLLPYILWNISHEWVSLRFQLIGRHAECASYTPHVADFLMLQSAAISPLFVLLFAWAVVRALANKSSGPRDTYLYLLCLSLPTYAFFLAVSFIVPVEINWPVTGMIGLIVLTPSILMEASGSEELKRRYRLIVTAASFPALAIILIMYTAGLFPQAVMGIIQKAAPENGVTIHYGYADIPRHLEKVKARFPGPFFIATESYWLSSAMSFYTGTYIHMCYGNYQGREYREWEAKYNLRGQDALFIDTSPYGARFDIVTMLGYAFKEVRPLEPWKITREGMVCGTLYPVYCRNLVAPAIFLTGSMRGSRIMIKATGEKQVPPLNCKTPE